MTTRRVGALPLRRLRLNEVKATLQTLYSSGKRIHQIKQFLTLSDVHQKPFAFHTRMSAAATVPVSVQLFTVNAVCFNVSVLVVMS